MLPTALYKLAFSISRSLALPAKQARSLSKHRPLSHAHAVPIPVPMPAPIPPSHAKPQA